MSTVNHNQIAVLSSEPAAIGRLFLTVEEAAQRFARFTGAAITRTPGGAVLRLDAEEWRRPRFDMAPVAPSTT